MICLNTRLIVINISAWQIVVRRLILANSYDSAFYKGE